MGTEMNVDYSKSVGNNLYEWNDAFKDKKDVPIVIFGEGATKPTAYLSNNTAGNIWDDAKNRGLA